MATGTTKRAKQEKRSPTNGSVTDRAKKMVKEVQRLQRDGATWADAHNVLFGVRGLCVSLFPTWEERTAYFKTAESEQVADVLDELPEGEAVPLAAIEASGKLLLRMPKTLHAALVSEAKFEGISLNQLMLTKLAMQLRALV